MIRPIRILNELLLLSINVLKKTFLLIVLLFLFIILSIVGYRLDNYMIHAWEAQIRWGHSSFESKIFRKVSTNKKAKMISDLLRKGYFIGVTPETVKETLGKPTGGYYNTESNLTYRIYEKGRTHWDIIFNVDYKTQKVNRVFVYRQSNGITKTALYGFMSFVDMLCL